jgi:putative peptide zinc metalloprotease protein
MVNLSDSLLSSASRRLKIRKRPDLLARRQRYQGRAYWIVKDPVGMHYFRFQEEEYAILQMLDGDTSLDEIKERFENDFPPQKITLEELEQFLGMLHRSGLILASVQGQGTELLKRRSERRKKELLGALSNILCIRFKGIDPERALNWLYPKLRWFFRPWCIWLCVGLALAAVSLILVQFDVFRTKLPEFKQFFSPANAFMLAITLALTKVLHEFGHGLSCKHCGGECHELGVMILVLTPCLYCNVSDSWMLPNKWHRAAIGAAGMYVELVLASICTFVWWNTQSGLLNMLCLNVMFVSSVSTVIFNANPLLRYDGYYILADVTEIPNLRQKATTILGRKMGEWFLGLEQPDDPFLPERNQIFFALYSVASAIYRWVIVFSILMFLYRLAKEYQLEVLGEIVVIASLYGLLFQPLWQLGKFFYVPGRLDKVKKPHIYATLGGAAALLGFVFLVPLPYSVMATLEIQARDAASIYVDVPGKLERVCVKPGQQVTGGDLLAVLRSNDLELKIGELEKTYRDKRARLAILERRRFEEPGVGAQIPGARSDVTTAQDQLTEKRKDLTRLRLTVPAGVDGKVLPPPDLMHNDEPEGPLPTWSGSPFEKKNLEASLDQSALFCQIGDPDKMEAVLVIDQADIEFVRARRWGVDRHGEEVMIPGDRVELRIDELPDDTLKGEIDEIAESDLKVVSKRLSAKAGGETATRTDPSGIERPLNPSYQARVPLDNPDGTLRLGLRGRAKIHGQWQTISSRVWRLLTQTFNFKL